MRENLNFLGKIQNSTKEVREIDKDGNESAVTISQKINFIGKARFIATLLSNIVDNLTEEIHKIKCKDCECFLEYESVREMSIKYKCTSCNKNYSNKINEELRKRFKTHLGFLI